MTPGYFTIEGRDINAQHVVSVTQYVDVDDGTDSHTVIALTSGLAETELKATEVHGLIHVALVAFYKAVTVAQVNVLASKKQNSEPVQ